MFGYTAILCKLQHENFQKKTLRYEVIPRQVVGMHVNIIITIVPHSNLSLSFDNHRLVDRHQLFDYGHAPLHGGYVSTGETILVLQLYYKIIPLLKIILFYISLKSYHVKCTYHSGQRADVGFFLQKQLHHVRVVTFGRQMQRRLTMLNSLRMYK